MSQLEVDKIIPQSGTTLTIGDSGDTVNFADGTSIGIDTNTLYIDSTNNRVGIGTISPGRKVTIYDSSSPYLALQNSTSGTTNSDGMLIGIGGSNAFIINYENQPLTFSTNATEAMRIDSSGNVGIGESAPLGKLHIKSADSGASANSGHNQVVAENSGNSGMSILSGNTSNGAICFGDDGNNCIGYVNYAHNGNHLDFGVNNAEAMRIDSSGNLLIGTTTDYAVSSSTVTGTKIRNDGIASFFRDNATPLYVGRQNGDGTLIDFRRSGTTVGSIATDNSSNLTIRGKSSSDFSILFGTNKLNPKNYAGTGAKDNAVDLGDNDDRWKDLYLGGGLYVGGTGTANKLDDYEEGTWTPTMTASGSGAITLTSSAGIYNKIGNLVYLWGIIDADLSSESGTYTFGGFPFNAEDVGDHNQRYSGVTSFQRSTGASIPLIIQFSTSSIISVYKDLSGNVLTSTDTTATNFAVRYAIAYRTAS